MSDPHLKQLLALAAQHRMPGPHPATMCCCILSSAQVATPCVCGPDERLLRNWQARVPFVPPMTGDQRAWCVQQIRDCGDSTIQPDDVDLAVASDEDLASLTLHAWQDYCRDKGLI